MSPRQHKHNTLPALKHPFQFKFKMSSLKQLIFNAMIKATAPTDITFPSNDAAIEYYIHQVFAELFPGEAVPPLPETADPKPKKAESPKKKTKKAEAESPKVASPKKPKKASKKAEAEVAPAPPAVATVMVEEVAPEEVVVPTPAAAGAGSPKKASPKKPKQTAEEKAKAKEEAKLAKEAEKAKAKEEAKALKEAEKAKAKEEAKLAKEAEKAKAKAELNVQKIDPTWRKALKEAEKDKEKAKALEAPLLAYLNAMTNAAFNGKGAKEHVTAFLATQVAPAPAVELVEANLEVVEFNGKEYYVNPETKRVYEGELDEDGALKVTRPVGYVDMMEFKGMKLE